MVIQFGGIEIRRSVVGDGLVEYFVTSNYSEKNAEIAKQYRYKLDILEVYDWDAWCARQ